MRQYFSLFLSSSVTKSKEEIRIFILKQFSLYGTNKFKINIIRSDKWKIRCESSIL